MRHCLSIGRHSCRENSMVLRTDTWTVYVHPALKVPFRDEAIFLWVAGCGYIKHVPVKN
jgi:hypothetical protein